MKDFKVLPAINSLLESGCLETEINQLGRENVKMILNQVIEGIRKKIISGTNYSSAEVQSEIKDAFQENRIIELKAVINGTGTLLHTNLGRAILSKKVMQKVSDLLTNYVNVEFDLDTGKRGKRGDYVNQLLSRLTNSEAALVVNNNASAVFLILNEFASNKEVIVSRGELVEIGGSFRVPDIMRDSGAILKEVGTTNKTKLQDYQANICSETAMLMKVHQSNYYISGFTEEADIIEISKLAKEHNILSYYDIGSGLLDKLPHVNIAWDHTVKEIIDMDVDLVSFSGDKLLGATQAGLIVGKKSCIDRLKKNPIYRMLRVGKLTDSVLYYTLKNYIDFSHNYQEIPFFKMLNQSKENLLVKAEKLISLLSSIIPKEIVSTQVRTGGGSMPSVALDSYAIQIKNSDDKNVSLHHNLLKLDKPIITYLNQGKLNIDIIAIDSSDFSYIADAINSEYKKL